MAEKKKKKKFKKKPAVIQPGWTPTPRGAPTKYKPEYCEMIIDYFDQPAYEVVNTMFGPKKIANDLPTLYGFCQKIGISYETLREWAKEISDFSAAVTRAKAIGSQILVQNALNGGYNPRFAGLVAVNLGDFKPNPETLPPQIGTVQIIQLPQRYEPELGKPILNLTDQNPNDIIDVEAA